MTIKFVCTCGKHLRARDEMAARRSACPRCGAPVGIPSLNPTHPGTNAGPMSPAERLRARLNAAPGAAFPNALPADDDTEVLHDAPRPAKEERPADAPWHVPPRPLDPNQVRLAVPRDGVARRRRLERDWFGCLAYPFHTWQLALPLATLLTVLAATGAMVLPKLSELRHESFGHLLLGTPYLIFPVLILGFSCGYLDGAMTSAAAGKYGPIHWTNFPKIVALRGGAKWLFCALAGPVVPAAACFLYWLYCGDADWLDWIILAELSIAAVAYWLLALLAVSRSGRLLDANPVRVVEVARRLGYRALVAALLGWGLALAHGLLVAFALEQLHHQFLFGGLLLSFGCASGTFCAAFLFRLLGTWCYQRRS